VTWPWRWTVRTPVALLLAAVLASGCAATLDVASGTALPAPVASAPAPSPSSPPPAVRDAAGVQAVLDDVADAFRAADPDALEPHLADPGSAFARRWLDRARHMAALPLDGYALRLDDALPDLSTQRVRDRYDGRVQVVHVVEELRLAGVDAAPSADDLFLTLVDTGDGWEVAGDVDGEPLGFVSVDHLWDHGPVEVTRDGPVLAIHHPDGPPVGALLEEAGAALVQADQRWPRDWPGTVPVVVPRDEEELGDLLHVTFDLSNFVAFATATPVGERGAYELTGSRVVVNPTRFLDRAPATRQRILVHELVHVATRSSAGPMVPSWLDEGVAQALGEQQSTTGTTLLDGTAPAELALPTDGQFTVGGQARIFLSYQLAWDFVDFLVRTRGVDAVGEFYAAAGRGAVGRPGTEQYHVDRAAREVLGAPLADLVEAWRAS
jgi:hypothetical protein